MRELGIDIETYSSADLAECGVYRYAESEDFDILLGNRGIAVGLNNVMKFKDDDSLGGRASADADFAEIKDDDDDDDL